VSKSSVIVKSLESEVITLRNSLKTQKSVTPSILTAVLVASSRHRRFVSAQVSVNRTGAAGKMPNRTAAGMNGVAFPNSFLDGFDLKFKTPDYLV
jgi:hypothetical protein